MTGDLVKRIEAYRAQRPSERSWDEGDNLLRDAATALSRAQGEGLQARNADLVKALRGHVIREVFPHGLRNMSCGLCGKWWHLSGPESHAPNCLAAIKGEG